MIFLLEFERNKDKKKYRTVNKFLDIVFVLFFRKVFRNTVKKLIFRKNLKERRKKVQNS